MNEFYGESFLDKLYSNLYMSDEVQHTKGKRDKRNVSIRKYMDRLERVHSKADTETKKQLLLHYYTNRYVVKKEDLPNNVDKDNIIKSQIRSLEGWLDYLSSPSASMYPMWAKYWAFQGMTKLGSYDSFQDNYQKRDKNTLNPFIEPNPEIIGKCMEIIIKLVKKEKIDTDIEEKLSKADSFKKIYLAVNRKYRSVMKNKSSSTDGIWKKYINNENDANSLLHAIECKNTGWCIANGTSIRSFLREGDFYIYYTIDDKGEYTIPRIAILTKGQDDIDQIRGIEPGENLEESMLKIVENKLNSMGFLTEEAVKNQMDIINGLRELNTIGIKSINKIKLTDEELKHFYTRKYGFGYSTDPKHDKIIDIRNVADDYNSTNDKEVKLKMIVKGYLPDNFVTDRDLMKEAITNFKGTFKYGAENIRGDKELFELSISGNNKYFDNLKFVTDKIGNDKEYIISLINKDSVFFEYANEKMKDDEDVVMTALKSENAKMDFFNYASPRLKNDKRIVLKAMEISFYNCRYIGDELKNDIGFVKTIINNGYPEILAFLSDLKDNEEIVRDSVSMNGTLFQYASPRLKDNEDILRIAIKSFGPAFFDASPRLQKNIEIFKEALKTFRALDKYSLVNTPKEFFKDKSVLIDAVKINGMMYKYGTEEDKKDIYIALTAIKNDKNVIGYLPEELKSNESFMKQVDLLVNEKENTMSRNM